MKQMLNITKALSDSNRLRALMLLEKKELCVCQLIEILQLAPSTVSKHMSILKQADLVDARRDGKWTHYRLATDSRNPMITEIITWITRNLSANEVALADKKTACDCKNQCDK